MRFGRIFVRKKLAGIKIRYAECRVHELLLHFIFGAFFLAKELIESCVCRCSAGSCSTAGWYLRY